MNITELLPPEAICLQMEAVSSTEVIERLGGALKQLGHVKEGFVEATLAREASLPTGLPLGGSINAAIPHVDIEYVNRPALGLATLAEPVVFHNMVEPEVEVPVRLVIMLALEQPKSQVEMLQQVAALLQRPDVVDRLMTAATPDEVFTILSGLEAPADPGQS